MFALAVTVLWLVVAVRPSAAGGQEDTFQRIMLYDELTWLEANTVPTVRTGGSRPGCIQCPYTRSFEYGRDGLSFTGHVRGRPMAVQLGWDEVAALALTSSGRVLVVIMVEDGNIVREYLTPAPSATGGDVLVSVARVTRLTGRGHIPVLETVVEDTDVLDQRGREPSPRIADQVFREAMAAYDREEDLPYREQDFRKLFGPMSLAAHMDHLEAQYTLGEMFAGAPGPQRDPDAGRVWWRIAAHRGHAQARFEMANHHWGSSSSRSELAEGLRWFRLAADQGHAEAQYRLGRIYENGDLVREDRREAIRWYQRAARQGLGEAREALQRLGVR